MKRYVCSLFIFFTVSIYSQQVLFEKISDMVDSVSTENLTYHIQNLENAGGHRSRVNLTPGNDSAAVYIKREFDKIIGLTSVVYDTFYIPSAASPFNTKPIVNIVATLEGSISSSSYYVFGAHYDCSASREGASVWNSQWQTIESPGADDNATGVATIIEIARILADPANNFQNDFTIKFVAFGAEESGPAYNGSHHGSLHFASNAKDNNDNILGMVSIDMIGYNNSHDYNSIVANQASEWFGTKFLEVNDIFQIELLLDNPPFTLGTYSDHHSFWQYGFKAILFIENAPPWVNGNFYQRNLFYHTSADTFGTLNMTLVNKVAQLNLAAAASFSARLTDVEQSTDIRPSEFVLLQNYPNPFNPTTKIKFSIPTSPQTPLLSKERGRGEVVKLKVYDLLGSEVATLLNKPMEPGTYEVEFNASGLPSGVYFFQLEINGLFRQTKKMLLTK